MHRFLKNLVQSFKSKRISQLPLTGFKVPWYEKIKTAKLFLSFIKEIFRYISTKMGKLALLSTSLVRKVAGSLVWLKEFLIKKLIWSRGRLGRPIANLIVLAVALFVFMFGEILNSSRFVNSQEINPDYLVNVTDIIPQRNTATTLVPESRKSTKSFTYTISPGDTLSSIGQNFKISTAALKYVNSLTDYSVLAVGDIITIPPVSGLIHEIEDGDTIGSIASKYDVPSQAIADFNYILDTSKLAVGAELVIPGATVPIPSFPSAGTSPFASTFSAPSGGGWCTWPTAASIVTQYFTWYHDGIDIAVPWGQAMPPLYSCSSGVVTRAGWDPWGLGLHVRIDHGNGFETIYGHMSRIDVGYGQHVSRGQWIGLMGNTGNSTGPHIHFTVKYRGVAQDPFKYF